MTIFYAKSTSGFYDTNIHDAEKIPADAVEISSSKHWELLEGQSQGLVITADETGTPVLVDRDTLLSLDEVKAAQKRIISQACEAAILAGFTSSALGSEHTYPAGMKDQQNLASSVLASIMPNLPENWTTPFWCSDSTGTWAFADHTAAQIQQVGQDGKAAIIANITKNDQLAAKIDAAKTVKTIRAITW